MTEALAPVPASPPETTPPALVAWRAGSPVVHPAPPPRRLRWLTLDAGVPELPVRPGAWSRWIGTAAVAGLVIVASAVILMVPAPHYTSQASFVVRSGATAEPSVLGTPGSENARIAAAYLRSRDAVADLGTDLPLREILARPEIDRWARFPAPFGADGAEALFEHMRGRIAIEIEEASGIVFLTATAHRPEDAQALVDAMLGNAEDLVNGLGTRARVEATARAHDDLAAATTALSMIQERLTDFRTVAAVVDPKTASGAASSLIGSLSSDLTALDIEIDRLHAIAPDSPRLAGLLERRRATAGQADDLRAGVAGQPSSLAAKLSQYEILTLERDLAAATLEASRRAVETAQGAALAKRLYLQRVSQPNRPDRSDPPTGIQAALLLVLLAAGVLAIRRVWPSGTIGSAR